MRYFKVLLSATALVAAASSGHAQMIVLDPQALVKTSVTAMNTAQQVQNGYRMISGMIHANGFADTFVNGLTNVLLTQPMGTDPNAGPSLMSGSVPSGGQLLGLFNRFTGQVQTYQPMGNDPEAQMMLQRAQAVAGQLTVAQQFMNSSTGRLSLLPSIIHGLAGIVDIKDSMDANTRVNAEQMTQSAQGNQLKALELYQRAEFAAQQIREELSYRKGVDAHTALAVTAATNAAAGLVNLVTR